MRRHSHGGETTIGYYFAFDAGLQFALRQSKGAIEHSRSLLEVPVYPLRGKRGKDTPPRASRDSAPSLGDSGPADCDPVSNRGMITT